jgi:hypothetical protein
MKRILIGMITLLLLLGSSVTGRGQCFSTKFLEEIQRKYVSIATVNSSMIEVLKKGETNEELLAFLNELSFLQIITISTTFAMQTDEYCHRAMEQVRNCAQGEELLSIKDGQRQTLLMAFDKTAGNKAGEIVFINCDGNTLTIVNITGNISINNLGKLSSLSRSIKESTKK